VPEFIAGLAALLGADSVEGPAALRARPRNHWDTAPLEARARVTPRSTQELSRLMAWCHARGQRVVIHGGLTGICDADRSGADDLVVSLERMTAVEAIDAVGRTATVQAGVKLAALQQAAAAAGLQFPLDLGARDSCTVGGNIATNAGGVSVIRHGMMRALVLGLEAVLADGTVVSSMNRMLKNNTGYDLKQLFIGSEGTLGVVTRAVLQLKEATASCDTALLALADPAQLAPLLRRLDAALGGTLQSFEAMWHNYYAAATVPGGHAAPLARDFPFYVLVESRGADAAADGARFAAALEDAAGQGLCADAVVAKSDAERARLWKIREDFTQLLRQKPVFLYDVSLPLGHMVAYIDGLERSLRGRWPGARLEAFGHVGDGNIHLFVHPGESGLATAEAVAAAHRDSDALVYEPLAAIGGSVSAEHGIGLEKKAWMGLTRSAEEIELMRRLKRALDPAGILNPGKVFDA
jgi:FAD/FMN-containing dehydrogenase